MVFCSQMFFLRASAWQLGAPGSRWRALAIGSFSGTETTYEGERWSIVTCAACSAIAGIERDRGGAAADHEHPLAS